MRGSHIGLPAPARGSAVPAVTYRPPSPAATPSHRAAAILAFLTAAAPPRALQRPLADKGGSDTPGRERAWAGTRPPHPSAPLRLPILSFPPPSPPHMYIYMDIYIYPSFFPLSISLFTFYIPNSAHRGEKGRHRDNVL